MEHRGFQYQVVQTANPTGYRWTVQLDASCEKTGTSYSRGNAIFKAVCVIEKAAQLLCTEPNIVDIVVGIIDPPSAIVGD
jgi:hypothetical protein